MAALPRLPLMYRFYFSKDPKHGAPPKNYPITILGSLGTFREVLCFGSSGYLFRLCLVRFRVEGLRLRVQGLRLEFLGLRV